MMNHMGAQASPVMTSIAMEQTTSYLSQIHDSSFSDSSFGQVIPSCPNGGCTQPSYPYALRCDSDASGLYYGDRAPPAAARWTSIKARFWWAASKSTETDHADHRLAAHFERDVRRAVG